MVEAGDIEAEERRRAHAGRQAFLAPSAFGRGPDAIVDGHAVSFLEPQGPANTLTCIQRVCLFPLTRWNGKETLSGPVTGPESVPGL
jgi:hypothetical protein